MSDGREAEKLSEGQSRKVVPSDVYKSDLSKDGSAEKEALYLARGKSVQELEEEAAHKEHRRTQIFKDNFETMTLIAIWSMFFVAGVVAFVWIWHLLTPATAFGFSLHWLTDEQVNTLRNLVTGGIIVSAVGDHFKRRLS